MYYILVVNCFQNNVVYGKASKGKKWIEKVINYNLLCILSSLSNIFKTMLFMRKHPRKKKWNEEASHERVFENHPNLSVRSLINFISYYYYQYSTYLSPFIIFQKTSGCHAIQCSGNSYMSLTLIFYTPKATDKQNRRNLGVRGWGVNILKTHICLHVLYRVWIWFLYKGFSVFSSCFYCQGPVQYIHETRIIKVFMKKK